MKRDTGDDTIEMFTHVQFPFLPKCPSTGAAGPRQHVIRTGTFLMQGPQDPSAPQQPQSFLSMLLMANLSMWVSSVRALLIASWLPSDWEQSSGEDRNGPIRTSWPSLHPPHRAAFFLQVQQSSDLQEGYNITFPSSMFSHHHELRKSNTVGKNGK